MFQWLKNLLSTKTPQTVEEAYRHFGLEPEVVHQPVVVVEEKVEVLVTDERKEEAPKAKKHKQRNRKPQPAVASAKNVPAKKGGNKPAEKKPAPKKAPAKAPAKPKTKVAKTTKQ